MLRLDAEILTKDSKPITEVVNPNRLKWLGHTLGIHYVFCYRITLEET